jgi:hypothetical protein
MLETIPCYKQVDIDGDTKMSIESWRFLLQTHSIEKLQPEAIKTFATTWSRTQKALQKSHACNPTSQF